MPALLAPVAGAPAGKNWKELGIGETAATSWQRFVDVYYTSNIPLAVN